MLPAFHRERIALAADAMIEEAQAALEPWRPGQVIDVYAWARELAMRIAMRALLGLDPDDRGGGATAAHEFERALDLLRHRLPAAGAARPRLAVAQAAPRARGARPDRVPARSSAAAGTAGTARTCWAC